MAFRFNSSSSSIASNTLSASHSVRSSFLSILKYSANCITCVRLAYLSPRSILLNIGVSISSKAANCLCSTPCSSLNSFILSPNNMVFILFSSQYESLQSVCIPEGVTTIPSSAFARCHNLTCVIMPGSLQTICGGAFSQCHKLTDVTIPDGVTVIETGAFPSYLDMAVVTCLAVIPPELGKDNFGFPAKILYVPAGSVEVYRKNAVWREAFETIAALP